MKSIFDAVLREEIIYRINCLQPSHERIWGKMNLIQMLRHCNLWDSWIQGKTNLPMHQTFLGKLFGKMALRGMIKNDDPIKRNMPAGKGFTNFDPTGNFDLLKQDWISLIENYSSFSNTGFIHDFFGPMTKEEIGILAYKHTDHHLRQFSA